MKKETHIQLLLICFVALMAVNNVSAQLKPDGSEITPVCNLAFEKEVIRLVNIEREKAGLHALTIDPDLVRSARYHAWDMATADYFEHSTMRRTRSGRLKVVYKSASERIKKFLPKEPRATAENIAAGQTTPEEVVISWMNSPGHRKNILNPKLIHTGVGYYKPVQVRDRYPHYWVQNFRGREL